MGGVSNRQNESRAKVVTGTFKSRKGLQGPFSKVPSKSRVVVEPLIGQSIPSGTVPTKVVKAEGGAIKGNGAIVEHMNVCTQTKSGRTKPGAYLSLPEVTKEALVGENRQREGEIITIKLNKDSCTMTVRFADGCKEACLIDSGAADSVISQRVINTSPYLKSIQPKVEETYKKYVTGNSAEVCTNKTLTFEFEVQGHKMETTAYILPTCGSFNMVYGLSSLRKREAQLDLNLGIMRIRKGRIPLRTRNFVKIKPGMGQIVTLQGPVPNNLNNMSMIMSFNRKAGPNMPRKCLVAADGRRVDVYVNNWTNQMMIMRPKQVMGRLHVNSLLDDGERVEEGLMQLPMQEESVQSNTGYESKGNNSFSAMSATVGNERTIGGAWVTEVGELNAQVPDKVSPDKSLDDREISISRRKLKEKRLAELAVSDEDSPDLYLTDEEILRRDVDLVSSTLSEKCKEDVFRVMMENREAFSLFGEVGRCENSSVSIQLKNEEGFFIRPFRYSEEDKQIIRTEIDRMVKQGVLVKSPATHVSPILLVKKRQPCGKMRYRLVEIGRASCRERV